MQTRRTGGNLTGEEEREPGTDRGRERIEGLANLLEEVCLGLVKTCRMLVDSRDIPRSMQEVLAERTRAHERDLKKIRAFLADLRGREPPG